MRAMFLCVSAVLLAAAAPAPTPVQTPADIYGPLFRAVQMARVFPDSKTFADAVPKRDPARIMADYRQQKPQGRDALAAFVAANFSVPQADAAQAIAPKPDLSAHITALWPVLTRQPAPVPPGSSALPLPAAYVVPGGRFREIYYWDSYFTMLGLARDGRQDLIASMLANFEALVERHGRVPNGTRSYYLSRSQPPVLTLMIDLAPDADPAEARRRLNVLRREHRFWMAGADCLGRTGACLRLVRMPDGSLLNRYFDDRASPRDEAWAEDVATAREAAPRPVAATWRDLRAAAESGWDFSSRWLDDPQRLASIRTTAIVPVDLNSLLHILETRIAARCGALGDVACADAYRTRAARRQAAMTRWLWQAGEGRFADHDWQRRRPTGVLSAATLYPLFAGVATAAQAAAVARTVEQRLLAPGGLRTTEVTTGQQWDRPNGWAPLQWIAVAGLDRFGEAALATVIACRFLATVERNWRDSGRMLEKYDIEVMRPGGGGEYPNQDGFGWTNGVTAALLARRDARAPCPGGVVLEVPRAAGVAGPRPHS